MAVFAQYAWATGDEYVDQMKFLGDFLNILPTFTPTFCTRRGLLPRLLLRQFHPDDANRYFLFLRDSSFRALRNVFSGAKLIGTMPLYTNEKVVWKVMNYPGPWLPDPSKPKADLADGTSFDMAAETESNVADLRRRVVPHDKLRTAFEAARVVGGSDHLVLETDILVVGSGAGGSFVAAEARRQDPAASPHPREGGLRRAGRVPPARAADDAAHLRHGVSPCTRCSAWRSPRCRPPS